MKSPVKIKALFPVIVTGLLFSIAAGILAGLLAAALGWARWLSIAVALYISYKYFFRGCWHWTTWSGRSTFDEFSWEAVIPFFVRQAIPVAAAWGGAFIGYYTVAWLVGAHGPYPALHAIIRDQLDPDEGLLARLPPDCPGWIGVLRYFGAAIGTKTLRRVAELILDEDSADGDFRRGRRLLTLKEARRQVARHLVGSKGRIRFGGLDLPDEAASTHFCIIGATGSGKSHSMKYILRYALPKIGCGLDHRAIVFDPKRDMVGYIHSLKVRCRVYILNPFDARSVGYWLSRDCDSYAAAQQTAKLLVGEEAGPNRFFLDAGRELLTGQILSLMKHSPEKWTLRDLLLVFQEEALLRQVLGRDEETRCLGEFFKEERTFANIRSSALSRLNRFSPIAACWDRSAEALSLRDFVKSESILVFGYDPSIEFALRAVNCAVYERLSELLLSQPESAQRQTWHFVDEAKEMGKLPIPRIATFGRGTGNRLVIGFQDIEGLRSVYTRELANELVAQCGNKILLRTDGPETAAFCAKLISDVEVLEKRKSGIKDSDPDSGTTAEQITKREAVLASELLSIPPTNPQNGLTGYHLSAYTGAFHSTISAKEIDELKTTDSQVLNFIPRPVEHQMLRPFDDDDFFRLGLRRP